MHEFSIADLVKYSPLILSGLPATIGIALFAIILGGFIGFGAGLLRVVGNRFVKKMVVVYVEVIRGVPLLVILYTIYFGIGTLVNIPRYPAAVIALGIFSGAYVAEIVRAAIQSIPRGQTEAGLSLGLNERQALRKIVLPQAFKRMVPPLAGQFITLTKDSSLASIIAIPELTLQTYSVITVTFRAFQFWLTTAGIYFVLGWFLQRLSTWLERRTHIID
jgi:polar amino acid transport system permease protein